MARRKKSLDKTLASFLESSQLFGDLGDDARRSVAAAGRIERLKRGEVLFRAGDLPDRIHLVLEGAIEILRETREHKEPVPVAYLTPGEMIGDMAIITGSRRRSSARVPEGVSLWTLLQEEFVGLTGEVEGYGLHLAKVYAHRLEETIYQLRPHERPRELAGRLEHFDLPTVVQTLASSGQTGVLTIFDEERATWAEVLLRDGEIERARCHGLEGDEAFYEIFVRAPDGEFAFRASEAPDADGVSRQSIDAGAATLLMEAMRLVDEVAELKRRLPDATRRMKTRTSSLSWDEPETAEIVKGILTRLRRPGTIDDLVGSLDCPTHTLYEVAAKLYDAGHIQ